MQHDFGVSHTVAILSISLFVVGSGSGPLLLGPLSEFFGRQAVYRISYCLFVALNFGVAFAPDMGPYARPVFVELNDPQRPTLYSGFSADSPVPPSSASPEGRSRTSLMTTESRCMCRLLGGRRTDAFILSQTHGRIHPQSLFGTDCRPSNLGIRQSGATSTGQLGPLLMTSCLTESSLAVDILRRDDAGRRRVTPDPRGASNPISCAVLLNPGRRSSLSHTSPFY